MQIGIDGVAPVALMQNERFVEGRIGCSPRLCGRQAPDRIGRYAIIGRSNPRSRQQARRQKGQSECSAQSSVAKRGYPMAQDGHGTPFIQFVLTIASRSTRGRLLVPRTRIVIVRLDAVDQDPDQTIR